MNHHYSGMVVITILTLVLFSMTSITYADELTYDQKLQFTYEKEQITSHVISALHSIINEDYEISKMHLIHPLAVNFPNIQSMISIHDDELNSDKYEQIDKLEQVLTDLYQINPRDDFEQVQDQLVSVFKVLNKAEEKMVDTQLKEDPIFQMKLMVLLLEKSIEYSQEYFELPDKISMEVKKQDSLSLAIKSHMILSSILEKGFVDNFDDDIKDDLKGDFIKLFLLYENDINKVEDASKHIIHKMDIIINPDQSDEPTIILKMTQYSNQNILIELHGNNFEKNQIIIIEYYSPLSDELQIINGKTTSQGVFHFPLEFSNDATSSYTFTVILGDVVLYAELIPQ